MNDDNLIPLNQRAKSVQRAIQSEGGKAKAEKVRKQKLFKELLATALEIEQTNSRGETKSLKDIGMVKLATKVAKGDLKAIELSAKILGELVNKTDLTTDGDKLDLTINLK